MYTDNTVRNNPKKQTKTDKRYFAIIPQAHFGYAMIDSQRGL